MVVDKTCARSNTWATLCESRHFMLEMGEAASGILPAAQAAELALLVDLEARWENLRKTPASGAAAVTLDLVNRQKCYETFHAKLVAYNNRHTPAHVAELLLNTPSRLGAWCRRMRDLYLQVEHDPQGHRPAHLLEKAYRCADGMSVRLNKDLISRSPPPATVGAAIRDLEALAAWCDALDRATTAKQAKPH